MSFTAKFFPFGIFSEGQKAVFNKIFFKKSMKMVSPVFYTFLKMHNSGRYSKKKLSDNAIVINYCAFTSSFEPAVGKFLL